MAVEVHEQEGQVVEHVHGGDGLVELDGVEEDGAAVAQDDVAEVKVAVAFANETSGFTGKHGLSAARIHLGRPGAHGFEFGAVDRIVL